MEYDNNGYIAAVLTPESQERLKKFALYPTIYAHHLTLAYRPSRTVWEKYQDLIGKKIVLHVTGLLIDSKAQAAIVTGCPSENEHPHITISCAEGIPPKYSNELMQIKEITPISIELDAEVIFVPFENR